VWRFGEVAVTVSIFVGSAKVISARGTVGLFFLVLFNCYFIQSFYPDSKKSSWFYYAIQKHRLHLATDAKSKAVKRETYGRFLWCYTILAALYFAELNYFFWALPTFSPRKFVKVYYIWKVILLSILLTACIVLEEDNSLVSIFGALLWYFVVGLFSFLIGGIATYFFAIDTEQYTKAIEADPLFLLNMIYKRKYIFIEKVMRSGVCSAHRLIEDSIAWMSENKINPNDAEAIRNFVENQPFCKLLYYLIKYEIVESGKSVKKHSHLNVEDRKWYTNLAVPALVYKCNFGRKETLRSRLASSILLKLVTNRNIGGFGILSSYEAIMDAGASLHFVRYHLNAPERFFQKAGRFNCTAQQLYDSGFDLLFCLRNDFKKDELILAGFSVTMLNHKAVLERDENGEYFKERDHLIRLKESGFKRFFDLNFTPEDLRSTNLFKPLELLEYNCESIIQRRSNILYSRFSKDPEYKRGEAGYEL